MTQQITIIAAVGRDGAIGRGGSLIFRIRDDMRRFRALTMGKPVVMGRRTFESLPSALPGRRNIVVTGRPGWRPEGAETAPGLAEAVAMCADAPEVMIIGGAQLYRAAMDIATVLDLTVIDADTPDADTAFPDVDSAVWRMEADSGPLSDPASGLGYRFVTLRRVSAG